MNDRHCPRSVVKSIVSLSISPSDVCPHYIVHLSLSSFALLPLYRRILQIRHFVEFRECRILHVYVSSIKHCFMAWQCNNWCCLNTLFSALVIATCSSKQLSKDTINRRFM